MPATILHGGTIGNGSMPADVYNLIDSATISGITGSEIASNTVTNANLQTISTAGKVTGAALTALASIPSAAGRVPIANLATGTPDGTKFIKDDGTLAVPAVAAVSGMVIQVQYTLSTTKIYNTDQIASNAIPVITDGTECMTRTFTASSTSNILKIDVVAHVSQEESNAVISVPLFINSTTNALAVGASSVSGGANGLWSIHYTYYMNPIDTNENTYRVRFGSSVNNTYFNGYAGANMYGGKLTSSITITEIKG